jgi:hypothetical protein
MPQFRITDAARLLGVSDDPCAAGLTRAPQCGPHRVVSLMSTEAVGDLGLEPGVLAVAVVKSTNVVVETPGGNS